jgi:hypothetical protein
MDNRPMCPMMMHHNMPMMQMPMAQMPMTQMPMMQPMNMYNINIENVYLEEDDRDEEYFARMQGENYHRMMPYVMRTVDRMEKKGDMIYAQYPDREMLEGMSEETYNNMIRDMPEMADEQEEERQFGGRRRFGRDLITVLLLSQLLGRRRRRRRKHDYDHGYGYGDNYNDFYYND